MCVHSDLGLVYPPHPASHSSLPGEGLLGVAGRGATSTDLERGLRRAPLG